MQIYTDLDKITEHLASTALTIGTFDGVHLGHQAVLQRLQAVAQEQSTRMSVVTFSNHPRSVLDPNYKPEAICTDRHKLELLRSYPMDYLFNLNFTRELSELTAEEFLHKLNSTVRLDHLVLGYDAHFGKDRYGNPETVKGLAKELGIQVEYVEPVSLGDDAVSSSRIRKLIREGNLDQAADLLGRAYTIRGIVDKGKGMGTVTGYPTANINVANMCLPPFGVYQVTLRILDLYLDGVANLGLAPSLGPDTPPCLEVHLFDYAEPLYGRFVEVFLHDYLRPERKFETLSELKAQINIDVAEARRRT